MTKQVLAVLVCVSFLSCRSDHEPEFTDLLVSIDLQISTGQSERAGETIETAIDRARSRDEWARLAKRGYTLAQTSGDWSYLRDVAENALSKFLGAEEFAVFVSYAALKQDAIERAAEVSREYLVSERYKSLADLIWFRAGGAGFEDEMLPDYSASLNERDASAFVDAARRLGHPALYLDAAMILAGIGRITDSVEYVQQFSTAYPVPAGYLLFDAGRFDEAEAILRPEVTSADGYFAMDALLVLDSLARKNRTADYREFAEWFVARSPDASPLPYRNLSVVYTDSGDFDAATRIAAKGLEIFVDDGGLQAQMIRAVRNTAGTDEAIELLESFRDTSGTNVWFEMIEVAINPSPGGYVRFEMALEELFFENPKEEQVARRLASLYAGERRYEELGQIIDEYEKAAGSRVWTSFLRGVIAVRNDDLETAAGWFEEVADTNDLWQYRYNLALVYSAMGKFEEAKEQFRQSASLTEDRRYRALVFAEIARTLMQSGDPVSALREATYSLDLDPSLTKAILLVRQLESEPQ